MEKYMNNQHDSLYLALRQMDDNRVKFLIVTDGANKVTGTLTDGDVRRGILNGMKLEDPIRKAACETFTSVQMTDGLSHILEVFRDPRIEFLPVLREDGSLGNLITRRALTVMLLTNVSFSTSFDYESLDENALEYQIFARPWGFYKTTILNDMFQSKIIYVYPKQSLSLQSHKRREEYWIVISGEGIIQVGESKHPIAPGGMFFIPKECKHRLTNTSVSEMLVLAEVQLGDYFGEDDIERFEDLYKRA